MTDFCAGKATDLVTRSSMGQPKWQFAYRVSQPPPGRATALRSPPHALRFNRRFWEQLDRWARNFDASVSVVAPGERPRHVVGFGEVGSMACHRATQAHNRARGLDLCAVLLDGGGRIDANASPTSATITERRMYLATTASLRRFFGTVLTAWYNTAHRDHWHIDDLRPLGPIDRQRTTDTTLIQATANLLDGQRLAIDGIWGNKTHGAYIRLVDRFGLACTDPLAETADALLLLAMIVKTAVADVRAGAIRSDVCVDDCLDVVGTSIDLDPCPDVPI